MNQKGKTEHIKLEVDLRSMFPGLPDNPLTKKLTEHPRWMELNTDKLRLAHDVLKKASRKRLLFNNEKAVQRALIEFFPQEWHFSNDDVRAILDAYQQMSYRNQLKNRALAGAAIVHNIYLTAKDVRRLNKAKKADKVVCHTAFVGKLNLNEEKAIRLYHNEQLLWKKSGRSTWMFQKLGGRKTPVRRPRRSSAARSVEGAPLVAESFQGARLSELNGLRMCVAGVFEGLLNPNPEEKAEKVKQGLENADKVIRTLVTHFSILDSRAHAEVFNPLIEWRKKLHAETQLVLESSDMTTMDKIDKAKSIADAVGPIEEFVKKTCDAEGKYRPNTQAADREIERLLEKQKRESEEIDQSFEQLERFSYEMVHCSNEGTAFRDAEQLKDVTATIRIAINDHFGEDSMQAKRFDITMQDLADTIDTFQGQQGDKELVNDEVKRSVINTLDYLHDELKGAHRARYEPKKPSASVGG